MIRTVYIDRSRPLRMLLVTLFAAAMVVLLAGCDMGGAISGYSEGDEGGGGDDTSDVEITSFASGGSVGVGNRAIIVNFTSPVQASVSKDRDAVLAAVSLTDLEGNDIDFTPHWAPDGSYLALYGDLSYGRTYVVNVGLDGSELSVSKEADSSGEVTIGPNPDDYDMSASFSADLIFSFKSGNAPIVVMPGDIVVLGDTNADIPTENFVDEDVIWHYDFAQKHGRPRYLHNYSGSGAPAMTAGYDSDPDPGETVLLELIWNEHDKDDTDPNASVLASNIAEPCVPSGLNALGDINGDGTDDAMYKVNCSIEDTQFRYNEIYLILGPIPMQLGMEMASLAVESGQIRGSSSAQSDGAYAESGVGSINADFDGDGHADVVAVVNAGEMVTDEIRDVESSELRVYMGSSDVTKMLDAPDVTIAMAAADREFELVEAGDLNGDRISDLIVTDRYYPDRDAENWRDPKVYVFYGGSEFSSYTSEADAAFTISAGSDLKSDARVDVIGNLNSDAYEDFFVSYMTYMGGEQIVGSFLMYGRDFQRPDYVLPLDADLKLSTNSQLYHPYRTSYPERAGDINNRGRDDFVVEVHDVTLDIDVYLVFMGEDLPIDEEAGLLLIEEPSTRIYLEELP